MSSHDTDVKQDAMEIVRYAHDAFGHVVVTEETLHTKIQALVQFFNKDTDPKEKVPFQYTPEATKEFEEHATVISSALDKVNIVLVNLMKTLYGLEKHQTMIQTPEMSQPLPIPSQEKPEKRPFFSLGSAKPTRPNPDDPYQQMLDVIRDVKDLIKQWSLVVEWQSYGREFLDDWDRYGFDSYLSTHRVMFRKEIVPNLLRVYSEGLQILLSEEKRMALDFGKSEMQRDFKTRMDIPTS